MSEAEAVQYARLLRPFSVKRMAEALWYVEARAGGISNRKMELLVDPPVDAPTWSHELGRLKVELEVLAEQCEEAWHLLSDLERTAEADYARAIDAMTKVLHGINATTPPLAVAA